MTRARSCAALLGLASFAAAQPAADYTKAAGFTHWYLPRDVPRASPGNPATLPPIEDGVMRLSLAQLVAAVAANNLTIASARYLPSIAQTDLLRARSGASPRGVGVSQIPSGVFSGAVGGSILGTAGGGGGGSSNAGGITGAAGRVSIRPSGLFDPTISTNVSLDRTSSPLNTLVVAGVPSVTNHTVAFSASYVQAYSTGTSVTVSYGVQRQASNQQRLLFDPDITPGFTATVSQQLMNGFGTAVNRALIHVAENEHEIELQSFRQQASAVLAAAEDAYWDLAAQQRAVAAARQALEVAQQLERINREQQNIGTMAELDVVTAQSQVASARRDLAAAEGILANAELQLKGMMVVSLADPLASARIEIADPFPDPESEPTPDPDRAMELARKNRPEIAVAEGNIKSQQDALPFIRNALLPNVNIFALVTTAGLYNVYGTAFTEAIHFRYPEYAFGVTVTFPLRNRQAQADEVRSRLETRQAEDSLVRSRSQVETDAQNAVIAVRQAKAQVAAAREALRLERQKFEAEERKLAVGLSTSYSVVLVQRDLFAAELAELQARDAFAKAVISLDLATGSTIEKSHLTMDELLKGN